LPPVEHPSPSQPPSSSQQHNQRALGFSNRGVVAKPADNPFTLMRYFGKQLHPDLIHFDGGVPYRLRDYIGLEPRDSDLPLNVRRSGISNGLGPASQAKAGFKRLTSVEDLRDFFSGNATTTRRPSVEDGTLDRPMWWSRMM
jgi:hypothetical protein